MRRWYQYWCQFLMLITVFQYYSGLWRVGTTIGKSLHCVDIFPHNNYSISGLVIVKTEVKAGQLQRRAWRFIFVSTFSGDEATRSYDEIVRPNGQLWEMVSQFSQNPENIEIFWPLWWITDEMFHFKNSLSLKTIWRLSLSCLPICRYVDSPQPKRSEMKTLLS